MKSLEQYWSVCRRAWQKLQLCKNPGLQSNCLFSDHSFICLDTVESAVLFDLLVCLCWGEGGIVGAGVVGVERR